MSKLDKKTLIRLQAEGDLATFIQLVHPNRVLGTIHRDIIRWWNREEAKTHQLLLMPRDHQKSALVAYRVAWTITRNPAVRVLYISSTANLAVKQLKFIKDILTSDIYRFYWPEMVNYEEGKREKWTETEIAVDHPKRKEEAVRDPTVFTAGLTTSITGLHCDVAVLDDVVVRENAYTEEGRERTKQQYSLLSSIEGADALEWVVGTRYHPKDLYNDMVEMELDLFDEEGELVGSEALYEKFECVVENRGDGAGEFIWPRQQRADGKWFGFDQTILAKKRAQYLDKTQFRAQYYNDPNDASEASISPEYFQYYDKTHLNRTKGIWYYKNLRLNVFAAIDFAYSLGKRSDYTSIVVVGVDHLSNYYVLDIDRFKTKQVSEYFSRILVMHRKWDFRKIRAEVTAAQEVIVEELKNNYIRKHGLALSVEGVRPTRHQGSKEERMDAILQPKYQNLQMWHYAGGNCQTLEEELVLQNPPHDDVKDALSSALEICIRPSNSSNHSSSEFRKQIIGSARFGGIR